MIETEFADPVTGAGSALGPFGGDAGEEVLEALAMLLWDHYGDAHAQSRFDSLHKTIDFDRAIGSDMRGKTCAYPEWVGRFNEHAIGTDITCPGA